MSQLPNNPTEQWNAADTGSTAERLSPSEART